VAAAYAVAHYAAELEAIAADDRLRQYAADYQEREGDVLDQTLRAVEEHVDVNSLWNGEPVSVDIDAQHQRARNHFERDRGGDRFNPTRGDAPGIVFVSPGPEGNS
jgi:hypothetical protein